MLACSILPKTRDDSIASSRGHCLLDWALPVTLGSIAWGLVTFLQGPYQSKQDGLIVTLALGVCAVVCYTFKERPVRLALGISAVLLAGGAYTKSFGQVLYQHRNYFGVLSVTFDRSGNYHRLIHGCTLHGQQSLDPGRRHEPLTYYHRTGPIGQVFGVLRARIAQSNVAIVGLGPDRLLATPSPVSAGRSTRSTPPSRGSRDPRYFTFLAECCARRRDVALGDARLRLREAPEHSYGLIVLDAFSSDAIPTHLLTREALQLYFRKLAEGGVIAFHINNKYIDLAPVLSALAKDAKLTCLVRRDLNISQADARDGKSPSIWAVMAAPDANLGVLYEDPRWKSPPPSAPSRSGLDGRFLQYRWASPPWAHLVGDSTPSVPSDL